MEFKQNDVKLPVANFDLITEQGKNNKRHGDLLPSSIRAIISGPSNYGKTNILIVLLTHPNGLRFENVYVYSKSLNQPKYQFLKQLLESIEGIQYFEFSDNEEVIAPSESLPNSIMVFDDIACEKQNNVKEYFCKGRHNNVDCFYLCQSYAAVPKHLVRDNVNLLILFRQDEVNLKHIYDNHVNTDMEFKKFKKLCSQCWRDGKHSFMVIDKERSINNGRYRKGFDCFVINIDRDKANLSVYD